MPQIRQRLEPHLTAQLVTVIRRLYPFGLDQARPGDDPRRHAASAPQALTLGEALSGTPIAATTARMATCSCGKASTREMNPSVPQRTIDAALERDEASARSEVMQT